MMRMLLAAAVFGSTSMLAVTAQADTLTISAWGGTSQEAQRKVYFEPFSKETGVSIVEDEFLGGIGVLRTQAMSGSPTWNVVQVEDQELQLGCEEGLYVPIDYEMLGIPQDAFIPGAATECGVGAYVWSKVLGYDGSKLEKAPQNWADFWDTTTWPGTRALRRGPQYNLEFALIADGVPVADVYDVLATPEGVDRAFAKLDEIKPNLIWWEAGAQPLQMMAAGEVVMTSVYNGRVTTSNRTEGTRFVGVWPGSAYSIDSWVIIDGTPNIETAHAFLKYASDPERQAQLPEYIAYGPTVVDAVQHVKPETAPLLPTTPANLEVAFEMDTAFWVEHIESLTERFDRWASQ